MNDTFLVKIDRSSVRRNPTAGRTTYTVVGDSTVTASMTIPALIGSPSFLQWLDKELSNFALQQVVSDSFGSVHIAGVVRGVNAESVFAQIRAKLGMPGLGISSTVVTDHKTYHTRFPEPAFLLRRLPTKVQCDSCLSAFDYTELESDFISDIECVMHNICPHCGEVDCCVIEYENLSDTELSKLAEENERRRSKAVRSDISGP